MLKLSVVTPEKKIVADVEVEEVFLPANRGELNILEGHAPLITTLSAGAVQFKRKGSSISERVAVSWGYCEVANNSISVLAETAEKPEEIDVARAEKALSTAEEKMISGADLELVEKARLKRERAIVRIAVARIPR